MSAALRERLAAEERYERRKAVRALLARPLLSADGPDAPAFSRVRRHAAWLQKWFATYPGWSLVVGSEVARLRKLPGDPGDGTRPARDVRQGQPFGRRRYVLLCLALAVLEREGRQTTLRRLAEQVVAAVTEDAHFAAAGLSFDLSTRTQRGDLVRVVRTLLDLRVLVRVEGQEESYLSDRGDVLYTVRRPALAAMLQVRRGPSTVEATDLEGRLRAITGEPLRGEASSPAAEGSSVPGDDAYRARTQLYRRLLDDPVLYHEDLDAAQRAYLDGQRSRLTAQIHEATGLEPEVRAEGIALVDERGDTTDLGLPEEGTSGHLTLLLAGHLADHARRSPGAALGRAALHRVTAGLIEEYGHLWRKAAREPGAEVELTDRCLERLEALRLVRFVPEGVVSRPAVGRFALRRQPEEAE